MDSMSFIVRYPDFLGMIKKVSKEKYYPIIEKMEGWDPHDLVRPDTWFPTENSMFGYVYQLFLEEVRELDGDDKG